MQQKLMLLQLQWASDRNPHEMKGAQQMLLQLLHWIMQQRQQLMMLHKHS